ncbi:diaminobutyrate--2-oxoglutarate transaminase [Ammoniphilus resinae]|uniref:Diaminobutyrate--2-oxoglutarate transaminase n=1 Tax=Ammoniphilus resinae TaxID=861532 RepID=A0ABS4GPL5_9BACL|nr:diaminobutyrate--2-oxoglutarate transaminase [Ammoniphilus resinae]MBP1932067.1 diaminobutyrate-2-oxoglutarate transaminase [Ammoniphilus resinae]
MAVQEKLRSPLHVFERFESEVRSYCRSFPTVFDKAKGSKLWDREGREYIDFFAGAGALNYGHNNPQMKAKIIEYMMDDGVTHSLDMATVAKEKLLQKFQEVILQPRGFEYKVMFPGPTGTNSVESALKLARKVTGREVIMSFTNAFHGMTIGSLAVTGNKFKRDGAGIALPHTLSMPYENYFGEDVDTIDYMERYLEDNGSGVSLPAGIILETVQGEGGINVASFEWMKKVEAFCRRWGILLIVDDVQVGCGRTGTFFSFEKAGIQPDIICLSKSIGGFGIPLALTLIKPEHDVWEPGEHNGTFRGHNLAFVAATEALSYWEDDQFSQEITRKGEMVEACLQGLAERYPEMEAKARGRGLMQGIEIGVEGLSDEICKAAFERGLIMETSGPNGEVVKVMPPLTIVEEELKQGLRILEESFATCKQNK